MKTTEPSLFPELKLVKEPKESPVVVVQIINKLVRVPRALGESSVTRQGVSSVAVTEDHRSPEVQQRRGSSYVDRGQPPENTNA